MLIINNVKKLVKMDELIHKLYLVKFIDCDIYSDIVFCIKNKYLQLLYDKIIMLDADKMHNIINYYLVKIEEDRFHFMYNSTCCLNVQCNFCQYINNFIIKKNGDRQVIFGKKQMNYTLRESYCIKNCQSCDLKKGLELLFYDPNKVILIFNCYTHQPDYNFHFLEKYRKFINKKYICLTDLVCCHKGISRETFEDYFSLYIHTESSKTDPNNTLYHVSINIQF